MELIIALDDSQPVKKLMVDVSGGFAELDFITRFTDSAGQALHGLILILYRRCFRCD